MFHPKFVANEFHDGGDSNMTTRKTKSRYKNVRKKEYLSVTSGKMRNHTRRTVKIKVRH